MSYILCFDFGGTSIKCGIGKNDGTLSSLSKFKTPESLDKLLEEMHNYYNEVKDIYEIVGVSISSCGAVDSLTGIIGGISAIDYIHNINWKEIIKNEFNLPLTIENDANCAALSELYFGNGSDVDNMLFLVIGTGIGGAIILDHKLYHGKHLFGGEFGMALTKTDHGYKNFSQLASTVSMVRKMQALEPNIEWSGELIFKKAYEENNLNCIETINTFFDNLALGIFNLMHSFDPDKIIIGGGISIRDDFIKLLQQAYDKLTKQLDFEALPFNVVTCKNKNNANLIGAIANFYKN